MSAEPGEGLEVAPAGTWVLRGGDLPLASSLKNLRSVHEAYGIWGICVSISPGKPVEDAAEEVLFGTRQMCGALSEELADEGWVAVKEPGLDWPNGLLTFQNGEPDSDEWDRLRAHLTRRGLMPNPNYQGR